MDDLSCAKCGIRLAEGRIRKTCHVCAAVYCDKCSSTIPELGPDITITSHDWLCSDCIERLQQQIVN